MFYEKIKGF